eukprot:c1771_g1_i2.p1 GENE.c1771_g1_i2~~c1771_g1_i2.p1  ORF type:complete len:152 (+),score=28.36 c1771_g1_i2:36-458(+)
MGKRIVVGAPDLPQSPVPVDQIIDINQLNSVVELGDDDPEFSAQILDEFFVELTAKMQTFELALSVNDAANAKTSAHAVKGVCKNIGARRLATIWESFQHCAENGNLNEPRAQLAEAKSELEIIRPILLYALGKNPTTSQ